MNKHTRHKQQLCPKCVHPIDSATAAYEPDAAPQEGDFSICINCTSVLRYGQDLQLCLPSLEEAESEQKGLRCQLEKVISIIKRVKAKDKRHFN